MSYKDAELKAAVARYVRSVIKDEVTELGAVDTEYTFNEVSELIANAFILDPSSFFYLLSLAANKVNKYAILAKSYVDDILVAIDEVGSDVTKIEKTSLLLDASLALQSAEDSISKLNVISSQQFSRYTRSLNRFIDKSLLPNIRRISGDPHPNTYTISRPPQEARNSIINNISSLKVVHDALLNNIDQIVTALDELLGENLAAKSVKNSISKIKVDLKSLKYSFDSSTDDEAISLAKSAFLTIKAGMVVVDNFVSMKDPRSPKMESSSSSLDRSNSFYPCSSFFSAEILGERSGPYHIQAGYSDEFVVNVNGQGDETITLVPLERASVFGTKGETFDIHAAQKANLTSSFAGPYTIPASPNNIFEVYVDGTGYTATLTSGSRTASELSADINAATRIDLEVGVFGDVATASSVSNFLKIEHGSSGEHSLIIGSKTTANTALGFINGEDSNDVSSPLYNLRRGVEANNIIRFVIGDINPVEVTLSSGLQRTAEQIASDIDASSSLIEASVEIVDVLPSPSTMNVVKVYAAAFGEESVIEVSPTDDVHRRAMNEIGFTVQESRSGYLEVDDVVRQLNISGATASAIKETVNSGSSGTTKSAGTSYWLELQSGTLNGRESTNNKLFISGGPNVGWYEITSLSIGAVDKIFVGRAFPSTIEVQNQAWEIHNDVIKITSDISTLSSSIVVGSGSANNVLGISSGTSYGLVSGVRVTNAGSYERFSRYGVKKNDKITFTGPTYRTTHTVVSVGADGYQVEVYPEVPNNLSAHHYVINGEGALAYAEFISNLAEWDSGQLQPSGYASGIGSLERKLNPLIASKKPSAVARGDAKNAIQNLSSMYSNVSSILSGFTVSESPRVTYLLNMLQEKGLDRSYELLMMGYVKEFFSLNRDSASYAGNFMECMRNIVQNDAPSKADGDEGRLDSSLLSTHDDIDADLDFSDQDDERMVAEFDDFIDMDYSQEISKTGY